MALIYDSADRLAKIIDHQGLEYGFSYDTLNRLTKQTRPGSNTTFAYNTAGILNTLVHTKAGCTDVINGQSLEYDFIGNKKKIITPYGNCAFDYDKNSQLTSATLEEISPNPYIFSYDSLGNRLTKNAQNFEYDEKFQYLKSDGEFFYAFDSNGNLIRKTSVDDPNRLQEEFIYSSENQLLTYRRIEAGSIITESNYAYDALGRRLEKKVVYPSDSGKDFTRRYMYDGGEIVTEVDGTNQVLANYTHSNLRTDDVLSVQVTTEGKTQGLAKAEGNYFYLKDSLGTITDITDSLGNLVQHFVYSPFGEIIKVTNKLNEDISSDWMIRTSYTFTNREYDEESGLYYYRARYYDASTGRFLQVDSYEGDLDSPSSFLNKYSYAENRPVRFIDSTGRRIRNPFTYGNYCGPYNNDGKDWSEGTKNQVDANCKQHDKDYARADRHDSSWRQHGGYLAPHVAFADETARYFYFHFLADAKLIFKNSFNASSWRDNHGRYNAGNFLAAQATSGYFVMKYVNMANGGLSPVDYALFVVDKYPLISWYGNKVLGQLPRIIDFL